jgi:hypothetical protein
MGSRWARIAVPLVGLFAVMAALAIVAGAPVVLFEDEGELSSLPAAPEGSREVAQVTATGLGAGRAASPDSGAGAELVSGTAAPVAGGLPEGLAPVAALPTSGSPSIVDRRPGAGARTPAAWNGDRSSPDKAKGHGKSHGQGKAKGHDKPHGNKGQGNAYGHDKSHGQGKANGHQKSSGGSVALEPPRGKKQGHVSHSGTGKKSGRSGRSHARPRG